jgi:general stress protein 26
MSDTMARIRSLIEAVRPLCVLGTVDGECRPQVRWMGGLVDDPQQPWVFYLTSSTQARKMTQIAANPAAQLMFNSADYQQVATLSGTAEAVDDREIKQKLWEAVPQLKQFFSSFEDPGLGVIRFTTNSMELLALAEQHEPYRVELG